MAGFRIFMKPGGWRVTDGDIEYGPYPTYQQAVQSADNLNLQSRAGEPRSFAPVARGDGPGVWEAREEGNFRRASADAETAAEEAIERARVKSTDSPAAGSASRGGGVV